MTSTSSQLDHPITLNSLVVIETQEFNERFNKACIEDKWDSYIAVNLRAFKTHLKKKEVWVDVEVEKKITEKETRSREQDQSTSKETSKHHKPRKEKTSSREKRKIDETTVTKETERKLDVRWVKTIREMTIQILYDSEEESVIIPATIHRSLCQTKDEIVTPRFSNFMELVKDHQIQDVAAPKIIASSRKPVFYPGNRDVAGSLATIFFYSFSDPVDKIQGCAQFINGDYQHLESMCLLYYLSCISFVSGIDLEDEFSELEDYFPVMDALSLFNSQSRAYFYSQSITNAISWDMITFHALFGCVALCKATENKVNLPEWCKRRYNAVAAMLQQQGNPNAHFNLTRSGSLLNMMSLNKPQLKGLVYTVTKLCDADLEQPIQANTLCEQTKMLTSYTEMTSYTLICSTMKAFPSLAANRILMEQMVKFIKEDEKVREMLVKTGIDEDDLPYVKLVFPNSHMFKTSDYPDLIKTARIIEQRENPDSKTIKDYKTRSVKTSVTDSEIKRLLDNHVNSQGIVKLTPDQIHYLALWGINADYVTKQSRKLYKEAKRKRKQAEEETSGSGTSSSEEDDEEDQE